MDTSQSSLSATHKDLPPLPQIATNVESPLISSPLDPPMVIHNSTPSAAPNDPAYDGEMSRFQNLKLQLKRKKPRPAPLLNLEPASHPEPDTLMTSLKSLELSESVGMTQQLAYPLEQRKRRTVVSSISPTKSVYTPSPKEASAGISRGSYSPQPSPLATTNGQYAIYNLNDENFVHLKDLGSGNSGVVLKVLHVPSEKTMARKIVHVDSKLVVQTQIIRELRIMHECRSPYIIEFYGAFLRKNNSIVLCMEYCNCGSLDKILQLCSNRQFPCVVLKKIMYLILSGLTYLYNTHKIIHRDIKPSNVLMTHKGEFKLCDFGVSRELTNSLLMADTFVGTSTYMSPERIQGLAYGIKSDVWSMGLMLYELATGRYVWCDDDGPSDKSKNAGPEGILDLLQRIVNESPPTLRNKTNHATGKPYDKDLCAFIDSCLIKDEKQRKTPQELLDDDLGILKHVGEGKYDKEVKAWAKVIRKLQKEKA